MAEMTVDEFAAALEQILNDIPPRFLRGLNGGVNLRQRVKRDGERSTLGEYIEEQNGACYVVLYYESFQESFKEEPTEVWREEISKTVQQGIRHLLEFLAARTRSPKVKLGTWQESSKKVNRLFSR